MGPPSRPDRRELRREGSSPDATRDAGASPWRATMRRVLDRVPEAERLDMLEEVSLDFMERQERTNDLLVVLTDEVKGMREDFQDAETKKARPRRYTAKELATLIAASAAALAAVSTSIGMLLHH
jgi:hypothetical protein